jgi:hypothetical protein
MRCDPLRQLVRAHRIEREARRVAQVRLALVRLQRAGRKDERAARFQPAGRPGQHRALQLGHLRDHLGPDSMQHVRVAPEDAGRAARRVEQDRVDGGRRLPLHHIGFDDIGRQARALKVLAQAFEPRR